eukprot:366216-Chlamydomonas_euryale.AAC.12
MRLRGEGGEGSSAADGLSSARPASAGLTGGKLRDPSPVHPHVGYGAGRTRRMRGTLSGGL